MEPDSELDQFEVVLTPPTAVPVKIIAGDIARFYEYVYRRVKEMRILLAPSPAALKLFQIYAGRVPLTHQGIVIAHVIPNEMMRLELEEMYGQDVIEIW